jgi:putative CRISPR-associated protein (TIGR02619 family)
MTTRLLLVSTCGTSVLTNEADSETRQWLTKVANLATLDGADVTRLQELVNRRRERLFEGDEAERRKLSAELNGIGAVLDRWKPQRVLHLLVHTDTAADQATARLVADILDQNAPQVQLLTAPGLRTDDFLSFRGALDDLTRKIEEWVPSFPDAGWTTIFNLTGGFKPLSAYLQAIGMLHAHHCVYLFESASSLMEIPRLPIALVEVDKIRPYLTAFRRLDRKYSVIGKEVIGVLDTLMLVDEGQATSTIWGNAVWQRVRRTLLSEGLLDPISPKLVVEKIRKDVKDLPVERRLQVNEALDHLAAHLDLGHDLPESHKFKKLEGAPKQPSTHELYLWSDGGAWRLFGHFDDDGHFIADSLGTHL